MKNLLLMGTLLLGCINASATIVDGVRQKPTYTTVGFSSDLVGEEVYLYNVEAEAFFSQGNSWATQASLDSEGRKMRFTVASNGGYILEQYCWRTAGSAGGQSWGALSSAWREVFFNSETALFVDRDGQAHYYFAVEDNGSTFRLSEAATNPLKPEYVGHGYYVGLMKSSSSTALSPYIDVEEDEGYVDWAIVTKENYEKATAIFQQAKVLKDYIDNLKAYGKEYGDFEAIYLDESSSLEVIKQACADARDILLGDDVTYYIVNPGFDEDISFNVDGTAAKTITDTGRTSNRSAFWSAEDGSIYTYCNDGKGSNAAGDLSWYGYIARINGWEVTNTTTTPEWVYFGSVPYNVEEGMLTAGDGNPPTNAITPPAKPTEIDTDDNTGALHLRAGWENECTYKQEVKLPTAKYHLEYWVINSNANSTATATNLTNIKFRKKTVKDTEGMSAKEWTRHEIDFVPIGTCTLEFGFKAANALSSRNPWIWIDGIKLYRLGDADPVEVLQGDLVDMLEEDLPQINLVDAENKTFNGLSQQIATLIETYTPIVESTDVTELQTAVNDLSAAIENIRKAIEVAPNVQALAADIDNMLNEDDFYPVATEKLEDARDAVTDVYEMEAEAIVNAETNLQDAIENYENSKELYRIINILSEAVTNYENAMASAKEGAQTVLAGANEVYNSGIVSDEALVEQRTLIDDAYNNLYNSWVTYQGLKEAIDELTNALTQKASQSVIETATEVLNEATTGYNNGSIADEDVDGKIQEIQVQVNALNSSATAYGQLATAIAYLETAIGEASTEEARVAKSTVKKANLTLNYSKEVYNDGSIADADIAARVESHNQLITDLTYSINLYKEFKQALDDLSAALATTDAMSSATRAAAQDVYDKALAAYNEGTVDDDQIEAQISALNAQIAAITNSMDKYAALAEAFESLKDVVGKKALQTLMDEVDALAAKQADYETGAIADEDIDDIINSIEEIIPQVNASAEKYAELAEAITSLEDAIAVASTDEARVAKSTVKKANLTLNYSKEVYNEGTIADADIPARVTSHNQLITDLTYSINLYKEFKQALENLENALTTTEPMSAATRTAAQGVYDTALAAYNAGTVDDDQIEAQKNALNAQITAINNSVTLYAGLPTPLANLEAALEQKAAQSVINTATTVFNSATEAYGNCSIADADVASTITSINAQTSALNTSAGQYAQLNTALGQLQTAITAAQNAGASVSMITNANSLKAGYQSGYDNGSEENVPAALTAISNAIANLGAAAPLYPQANNLNTKLADLATELGEADDAIAEAEDALEQYLSSELRSGLETALDDLKAKVNVAKTNKSTMADDLAGYQLDLTNSESTLGEDHADLYADMGTAFNTMSGNIDNLINSLYQLRTNLEGVTENAVAESANKVEIAHNIATFCSMMDLDFTDVEKVRAYIVSAFTPSTGDAILTRVYDVPKGTGVVLIGDNGSYEIPAGTGATVVSNLLVGVNRATVLHQVDGDYTNFILTNGESGEGFYPVEDGSTLAAGKAYLPLPTASLPASGIGNGAAIRFVFEDRGEATFIDSVGFDYAGSKMEKGVYYNLNGQRVERPVTGGIYILDGKKVYVK